MATSGSFNTNGYQGRKLRFEWKLLSQDVEYNESVIEVTLKGYGEATAGWYMAGNFKMVINGRTYYETSSSDRLKLYNGTVLWRDTPHIKHNADGSKSFSASVKGAIYAATQNVSGSGSWTLPSIPRKATVTSAPNFNDEGNPTIKYSNKAGNSVTSLQACISLTGSKADVAYRDISKTGTSYTFNLTDAEREVLRKATTGSNSRTDRATDISLFIFSFILQTPLFWQCSAMLLQKVYKRAL